MNISSKLPRVGTTIFTVMSQLAREYNAVNLSQGFPNFDCDEQLKDLVTFYMAQGKNQYAPMPGLPELQKAISNKVNSSYNISVSPEDVTITAGATQALYNAITATIKPGDEVIIIEPAYDSYRPVIQLCGGIPRIYELSAPDYRVDWKSLSKLVSGSTKMIIINNPHNPLGKIFQKEDLEALLKIVDGTDILILSDEVYEHIVFDNQEHWSVLKFPELRKRSMVVFSFGKTFHNTGWKVGYSIAPSFLTKEIRKIHQFNVFSVNTPVQYALAEYLQNPESYSGLGQLYQGKRDFFQHAMKDSRLVPLTSEGSYFQLYDYSAISDEPDTEFAKRLTTEYGVAAIPISVFYTHKRDEKVIRLCFAKTEAVLAEAAKLLTKV
ncbi:MAG: methionine aminotransferase [Maribacter sp.]|jgi:methionine aminotransferase